MKRIIYISIVILGFCTYFLCNYSCNINNAQNDETNKSFRIIANLDTSVISNKTLITPVNKLKQGNIRQLFTMFNVSELQAVYRNRFDGKGDLKPGIISSSNDTWQQIILKDNIKAIDLVTLLKKEKGVLNIYIERPMFIKPCIVPNDPLYSSQWHLRSISYPMADINAEQAWDINRGRSEVIIAVCDGGVDYTHSDLDPGNRSRVIAGYDSGSDDNDPMDDLPTDNNLSFGGHGTHVAGIIGAIAHNGNQVSGVMWNCRIMPVKMVGSGGFTFSYPFGSVNWDFSTTAFPSDVADAIDYAVNNGAHVINLSYGFSSMGALLNEVITRVPLLYNSILNAYNHNVVVVAAMGNEYNNGNKTQYPAAFPEVIAVGSLKNSNPPLRSSFSSTGPHISISAPGDNILSTIRGNSTGVKSGTSMAAPVVSGIAGLIISQGLDRNFNLTNDDARHIIEKTAVDIGTTGFDYETGYGLINAQSALQLLQEPNVLTHYNSIGGTSVKLQTLSQWILVSNTSELAAGTYLSVDQYKITKHINFDSPYCSAPTVWMRDRESKCLSESNPNNGRPFSTIKNVTNTGFDLEYYTYYVRYNQLGQAINKWIPVQPAATNIAYTVVGIPNFAAVAYISGPSTVCSSGNTFTLTNLPPDVNSIEWMPGPGLTITSGQYSASCTFSATGNAISWVRATLVTNCGSFTLPQKNVTGGVTASFDGASSVLFGGSETWNATASGCTPPYHYEWWLREDTDPAVGAVVVGEGSSLTLLSVPRFELAENQEQGSSEVVMRQPPTSTRYYLSLVAFDANGMRYETEERLIVAYGEVDLINMMARMSGGEGENTSILQMKISPNPATDEATVEICNAGVQAVDEDTQWQVEIYDATQLLKNKIQKIKGSKQTIRTTGWKEGVYIVRAKVGNQILSDKLVIKP